jgi:hypothetical protein
MAQCNVPMGKLVPKDRALAREGNQNASQRTDSNKPMPTC